MRTLLMGATVALLAAAAWAQPPEGPMTVRVTDVVAEASETISLSLDDLPAATPAAGLGALDMRAAVRAQARGPTVMVEVTLQDLRAEDRAVDLDVTLPMDLTGWTWWHDINAFEPIDAASQFAERRYPLVVVTSNAGGLAMAIEPDQPVVYELRGAAEGLTLHARLGLTPLGEGDLKSAAHVRLYLYPVDAEWGFRDALATYYALFPAAFERLAMDEGQWLFAFENTRLPNPSHYAYHEGGPGGWQYDEEHGIGTYPYTEVSSRTVTMHRLPSDREDAFVAWDEYRQDQELALAGWGMRGGVADDTVARTGGRSLRCAKDDPGAWVGAVQDVMVDQQAAEPVTISGWLKAQDVTGASDREVSLYGDVLLQSGEWLFGQIAAFEPGTHDWQQATWTVETDRPVRMVRLHCLFRAGHTGTVWFDDIAITVASKPGENLALNPSFEEIGINPNVAPELRGDRHQPERRRHRRLPRRGVRRPSGVLDPHRPVVGRQADDSAEAAAFLPQPQPVPAPGRGRRAAAGPAQHRELPQHDRENPGARWRLHRQRERVGDARAGLPARALLLRPPQLHLRPGEQARGRPREALHLRLPPRTRRGAAPAGPVGVHEHPQHHGHLPALRGLGRARHRELHHQP